jgi:hypothetical protein
MNKEDIEALISYSKPKEDTPPPVPKEPPPPQNTGCGVMLLVLSAFTMYWTPFALALVWKVFLG